MAKKKFIALGLVCVILAAGFIGTVLLLNQTDAEMQIRNEQISEIENEKSTLETQLSNIQTEKATLETQVTNLQSETTTLNNEVNTLETQVSSLQGETNTLETEKNTLLTQVSTLQTEKATLETQVTNLQSETSTLNNELSVLESQVSSLQTEVTDLENDVVQSFDLGYDEGESDGYQVGYDEGYTQGVEDLTQTGWYLRDPTYEEAIAFINSDKTDENQYTTSYVCYDFTADFNENAAQAGYRCGFVYIEFVDSAHAISCFNTTDQGLICVEPQNDEIVTLAIGQLYIDHIIVDLGIIW